MSEDGPRKRKGFAPNFPPPNPDLANLRLTCVKALPSPDSISHARPIDSPGSMSVHAGCRAGFPRTSARSMGPCPPSRNWKEAPHRTPDDVLGREPVIERLSLPHLARRRVARHVYAYRSCNMPCSPSGQGTAISSRTGCGEPHSNCVCLHTYVLESRLRGSWVTGG